MPQITANKKNHSIARLVAFLTITFGTQIYASILGITGIARIFGTISHIIDSAITETINKAIAMGQIMAGTPYSIEFPSISIGAINGQIGRIRDNIIEFSIPITFIKIIEEAIQGRSAPISIIIKIGGISIPLIIPIENGIDDGALTSVGTGTASAVEGSNPTVALIRA